MRTLDLSAIGAQANAFLARVAAGAQPEVLIAAGLLVTVIVLSLAAIWRSRARRAVPLASPSAASGFTRWLTPMGMQSIPAEQAVVPRPKRRSGSNRTIKVSTPVSKVTARAVRGAGASALEIARRTGLSRDAVTMMMAAAAPQSPPPKRSTAKSNAAPQEPTRTVSSSRAMSAPPAYAPSPRGPAPDSPSRGLGTRYNARLG